MSEEFTGVMSKLHTASVRLPPGTRAELDQIIANLRGCLEDEGEDLHPREIIYVLVSLVQVASKEGQSLEQMAANLVVALAS